MVDAARQMLDELMGRNRNLHPSEAPKSVSWEDPELCQYFLVKFCPHELFVNTRADLGPCDRIHDEEAKRQYEKSKPSILKRQYEDEFLYFCNSMLNDVDRKILKGKQRLALIQKDQPPSSHYSRYREQLNNLNARIKKLLAEAEEAGTRGDVDQAQDLMILCEQLKDERDNLMAQQENSTDKDDRTSDNEQPNTSGSIPNVIDLESVETSPNADTSNSKDDDETSSNAGTSQKNLKAWIKDIGHIPEKQMEVCEVCGAFLIVGDAQQRIEDHLMGKQHLGYSKLRKAVEDIHLRRQMERSTDDDRKRREERSQSYRAFDNDRRRDREVERDFRERSREHGSSRRHDGEKHRRHHKSHHRRRSHSRSRSHRSSHDRYSRSRSRSRY